MSSNGPPQELRLDAGAVARLNWQARICPAPLECIASRRGDVIELVFGIGHNPASRRIKGTRHRYRIEPLTDDLVLAKRIDEPLSAAGNG